MCGHFNMRILRTTILLLIFIYSNSASAARIKDMSGFKGVRSNQLIGYGLVVGLDGTGDSTNSEVMKRSLGEALSKMGIGADPSKFQIKNVASVMVTASLPPFAKTGSKIDVLVSSIGDAKSLQGGTLLMTPLRAANQEIYSVAQGPVSTGGFSAEAPAGGSQVKTNHQTVAKVSNGGIVEKEVDFGLDDLKTLELSLNEPDFTTASRVAATVNDFLKGKFASAEDSGSVTIKVPGSYSHKIVNMIANIESLEIQPDVAARVVLNERTGTVVMGENVRVSTVAVSHGSLSINIDQTYEASQPNALSKGDTVVLPETEFTVDDGKERKLVLVQKGMNIGEVVKALNAIGVTPRDLITVLQSIKAAGALQGELILI